MSVKRLFLFISIAVVATGLIFFVSVQYRNLCEKCLSLEIFAPEAVRNYIHGFGSWAIVVYILLYAVNTITLLPPIAIMSLSAGFLFGPVKGFLALTVGAFLGTSATMIGILPAIVIQVFFSDRLSNFDPRDPTLYIAVGAIVLLVIVPAMILKARKKATSRRVP